MKEQITEDNNNINKKIEEINNLKKEKEEIKEEKEKKEKEENILRETLVEKENKISQLEKKNDDNELALSSLQDMKTVCNINRCIIFKIINFYCFAC